MDIFSSKILNRMLKSNSTLLGIAFVDILFAAHLVDSNSNSISVHSIKYNLINLGFAVNILKIGTLLLTIKFAILL